MTRQESQKIVEDFEDKYGVKSENLPDAFRDADGALNEEHEDFWLWHHHWSILKMLKRHE